MVLNVSFFKKDGGCRRGSLCSYKHARLLARQGKCYNCGAHGHRASECSRPEQQQGERTEKRDSQNPRISQALEIPAEDERENVSKIVAATVREILGDPDSSVSVNTLTIAGGVLNMTHIAKQECNYGLWIVATGATHESVSLRSKAVKSLKQLDELAEKNLIDTMLAEGELVCVAPAQDPDPVERNDHGHGSVGPALQEEENMLDVPLNGFCNVICDDNQFFECNENDESDDFDVNTVPLTVHLVLRDSETTVMDATDVETSFGDLCEKWRLAIQNEMQSLREHNTCQEVTAEKRWTVPSTSIIPGKRRFSPSEIKAQRRIKLLIAETFRMMPVWQSLL